MLDIIKTEKANKTLKSIIRTTSVIAVKHDFVIGGTFKGSKFHLNTYMKMILSALTS